MTAAATSLGSELTTNMDDLMEYNDIQEFRELKTMVIMLEKKVRQLEYKVMSLCFRRNYRVLTLFAVSVLFLGKRLHRFWKTILD
jgi:hypothetical protein